MKIIVGQVTQYNDTDTDTPLLAVPYNIIADDGSVLSERIQSFPLDTTKEDIEAFCQRALGVYQENVVRYEASKALQASINTAEEVASSISGLEIN